MQRSNDLLSLRAFLLTIYVKDRELRQELPDATRAIRTEHFGARYAAMKRNRPLRPSLLDRALNGDLVRHPSSTDMVALDERDAMLQREFVDLLTVDDRDHDLVVANDALSSGRSKRQGIRAWTIDRLVVHRNDTKIAFFIAMANVVMARRGSEEWRLRMWMFSSLRLCANKPPCGPVVDEPRQRSLRRTARVPARPAIRPKM